MVVTKLQATTMFGNIMDADGSMEVVRQSDGADGIACGMQCNKGIWYVTVEIGGKVVSEPLEGFSNRYFY